MRVALFSLMLIGCASPLRALKLQQPADSGEQPFRIFASEIGRADVDRIRSTLITAMHRTARWGGLRRQLNVYVLPDHESLEKAVGSTGLDWLRAWATYDEILLQAPSTWASDTKIFSSLVTHELTHCLLFQRSGGRESWKARQIPWWFREGMAVWTAEEGADYPTWEDTAAWLARHRERGAFWEDEASAFEEHLMAYGIAYQAFGFLVRRYRQDAVLGIMSSMESGHSFADAFVAAVGLTPIQFQRDFENFLRFRGFRGWGLPVNPPRRLRDRRRFDGPAPEEQEGDGANGAR